ncbi:novel immune-type receptor 3c isoform X2 [Danio rerio]|uniref:Novel immune-type receptor 3c isoform X2 n=1 Tax=Danio rerio TaxID=7955 RepID=A0AC58G0S9_DANRE
MSLQGCFTFFLLTFAYGTCEEDFIHQQPLVLAELGSSVTLPCFHSDDFVTTISWYKHSAGKKPLLIAYSDFNSGRVTYRNAFNNTNRFFITVASGSYNLTIIHLEKEDFATYYCVKDFLNRLMFGEGTILLCKETDRISSTSVIQQPVSDRLHPGDSVTLQCSVSSHICAGHYRVYWFKHSSGYSQPGIIYTHDNRSDQCLESSEKSSFVQSCVYSLSQTELTTSDAGVYYCAVDTCGKIRFGNGTKLTIEESSLWSPVVLILFVISAVSIIVNIFLIIRTYCKEEASEQIRNRVIQVDTNYFNYVALQSSSVTTSQEETICVYTQTSAAK